MSISQEYFDELVLENHELFEGSEEDAVKETVLQLQECDLQHISCTFPTDRSRIQAFRTALKEQTVSTLTEFLKTDDLEEQSIFRHLFLVQKGFSELLRERSTMSQSITMNELLTCVNAYCSSTDPKFRTAFQATAPNIIQRWLDTYENTELYWDICYMSIYRCEANKKLWMKHEDFSKVLMQDLKSHFACRVLTCLCTFDDFENADMVQSSHQTVQVLATPETIDILHGMMMDSTTDDCIPAILALRAIAVQDQVVVRMMDVLSTAVMIFTTNGTTDNVALIAALLGLFRNVSANDTAKNILCSEDTMNALHGMGGLIRTSREAVEHASAWIAAMALRNPQNASFLIQISIPETIVAWMQEYPESALVQRQAALALRNLASRATPEEKAILLTEAQEALTTIAARHLQCQDQVYAALRDMGASGVVESIVHVEKLPDGNVRVRKTEQFGEGHNANFRPVFD